MWRKRFFAEAHLSVRPRLILSKSQFKVAIVKVGKGQRKSIKDGMLTYFFVLFSLGASISQPLMSPHLKHLECLISSTTPICLRALTKYLRKMTIQENPILSLCLA